MQRAAPLPIQLRGNCFARGLLRLAGWRVVFPGLPTRQGVLVIYPHTSNWDFVIGILAKWSAGLPISFWSKDELFAWPLFGAWLRWVGGIAVDRKSPRGRVADMVARFAVARAEDRFLWLGIAPEGTRGYAPAWRTGFYQLAHAAGVPVGLGYIDYARRVIGVDEFIALGGDRDADMAAIALHLGPYRGRRPDCASPIRFEP